MFSGSVHVADRVAPLVQDTSCPGPRQKLQQAHLVADPQTFLGHVSENGFDGVNVQLKHVTTCVLNELRPGQGPVAQVGEERGEALRYRVCQCLGAVHESLHKGEKCLTPVFVQNVTVNFFN